MLLGHSSVYSYHDYSVLLLQYYVAVFSILQTKDKNTSTFKNCVQV